MATSKAIAAHSTAPIATIEYRGIARLPSGKWRSYIVNRDGWSFDVGDFGTAEEAALAHDRAILAILGPNTSAMVLNFRAAFSDTELRFLHGRHAPARPAGVIAMVCMSGDGSYDAELARFSTRAFDAYMDPELALDVANFRLAHGDMLHRPKEEATATIGTNANQVARAKAELDVERKTFVEAARNKATNKTWVETYHKRQQQTGRTLEDENRWPQVLPIADVHVDWFPGEELIYMPHGTSHVDEMILGNTPIKNTKSDACMPDDFLI